MKPRKRNTKANDPLLHACSACGARIGEGCLAVGRGGQQLPLVPIATRLVHADRIEQPKDPHA